MFCAFLLLRLVLTDLGKLLFCIVWVIICYPCMYLERAEDWAWDNWEGTL